MIGEKTKRISFAVFIGFVCASLLNSQNLVEIAKKEKERRAALRAKGITSIVVTNADLNKQKRLAMIAVRSQDTSSQGRAQDRRQPVQSSSTRTTPPRKATQETQSRDVYGYRKNATKVIFYEGSVKNARNALSSPDNKFAEISEMGVLDLEFNAKNGPGADIAVYAYMAIQLETTSAENEEGGIPVRSTGADPLEGFWYGVLVMDGSEEWQEIGRGSGMSSPEEFDLGDISEVKKIRIMFKSHNNPGIAAKLNTVTAKENMVSIDAVEALH